MSLMRAGAIGGALGAASGATIAVAIKLGVEAATGIDVGWLSFSVATVLSSGIMARIAIASESGWGKRREEAPQKDKEEALQDGKEPIQLQPLPAIAQTVEVQEPVAQPSAANDGSPASQSGEVVIPVTPASRRASLAEPVPPVSPRSLNPEAISARRASQEAAISV
jgi:hypothetical protein